MKDLEKSVKENSEFFNSEEPKEGHFDRFESKLKDSAKRPKFFLNNWRQIAAVFVITILSGLYSYEIFNDDKESNSNSHTKMMALGDISPEYKEVEYYFVSQIESGMDRIEQAQLFQNPEEKQMLLDEINAMDSVYKNLQIELNANPNDERVIEAMIQYYRTKVNIMNNILNKFEKLKTKRNETTSI